MVESNRKERREREQYKSRFRGETEKYDKRIGKYKYKEIKRKKWTKKLKKEKEAIERRGKENEKRM